MSPILQLLAVIALVLYIVFGYFYLSETKKLVVATIILIVILILWFVPLPVRLGG